MSFVGVQFARAVHASGRAARAVTRPLTKSDVDLEKPVFLWGSGESGTFVLYDLLSLTGAFAFRFTTLDRKKGLARQLARKPVEGIAHWVGAGVPFDHDGQWIFDKTLTKSDLGTLEARVVRRRYENLARSWRWTPAARLRALDKFPYYVLMADAIDSVFPDARHVFVLRDPRLILSSIVARFKIPGYETQWKGYPSGFFSDVLLPGYESLRGEPPEVRHAWQIEEVLRVGFAAARARGSRCLIARHEHLLNDPAAHLARVGAFTGVSTAGLPFQSIRRAQPLTASGVPYVDWAIVPERFSRFAVECGYDAELAGRVADPSATPDGLNLATA